MYHVDFAPDAEADLGRLDAPVAQRVLKKLRWLAKNLDVITPAALSGQWQVMFKLRAGDYRLLYTFDRSKRNIVIHFIRHRSEVYK